MGIRRNLWWGRAALVPIGDYPRGGKSVVFLARDVYSGHMRCEDYPCCGHTDGLGCNWTYTPEAAASDRIHAFCNHEAGHCEVDEAIDSIFDEDECDPANSYCAYQDSDCAECEDYWLDFHAGAMMEDRWLDGSYEE